MSRPTFAWGAASDVGQLRDINQDSHWERDGVFVVADGMGGHRGGEVASALTIEALSAEDDLAHLEAVLDGVGRANAVILERAAQEPELTGMGTTLCALVLVEQPEPQLAVINVGDSRVYRFADDRLLQVTQDHSLVETLVREGQLSAAEADVHPQRNILTRALGVTADLEIDYWSLDVRRGDRYVLCSDGLFNEVGDADLARVCAEVGDAQEAAETLVAMANEHGGRDNVTVVIVDVADVADGPDGADSADTAADSADSDGAEALEPGPPRVAWRRARSAASPETPVEPARLIDDPLLEPATVAPAAAQRRRGRWRRLFKMSLFTLVVLGVLGAGLGLVGYYARANYYVGIDSGEVVVFQGRVDGVLWIDPTIEVRSGQAADELTDALRAEVAANPDYGSLDDALAYVAELPARNVPPTDSGP